MSPQRGTEGNEASVGAKIAHTIPSDLALSLVLTAFTLAVIFVPYFNETIIRSALGLIFVLFIPGYVFIAALFPGKDDIGNLERAVLSFGLSIAVVPLIGLALNFTRWGVRLEPITVCVAAFTAVCVVIAATRRGALSPEARYSVDFSGAYHRLRGGLTTSAGSRLDRALSVVLLISILASVAGLVYVVAVPKQGEAFTEFYLLGPNRTAENYPTQFVLGEAKPVVVGVMNHEYRAVPYGLVVALNDGNQSHAIYQTNFTLDDNQGWVQTINVEPDTVGTNMKLGFFLVADGNYATPYRDTYLWVNVTRPA